MTDADIEKASNNLSFDKSKNAAPQSSRDPTSVRRLWGVFWKLSMPYWKQEPTAKWKLLLVSILALIRALSNVFFSFIIRYAMRIDSFCMASITESSVC